MNNGTEFKFLVIGTGLPRTGTLSTKLALEMLLPGKCMHMKSVFKDIDESLKLFKNDVSDEVIRQYFEKNNIVAGVDAPFILIYKRMMRLYPDAIVLLTVRDPESWMISVKNTIASERINFNKFPYFLVKWIFPPFSRLNDFVTTDPTLKELKNEVNNGRGREFYNRWIDSVRETVPKEKLLVFNVKEGWKPLCDFLKVPIPEGEFPRVNDTIAINKQIANFKTAIWVISIVAGTVPLVIGCYLKYRFQLDPLTK